MTNVKMRKIKLIANEIDCITQTLYEKIETNQKFLHDLHEELEEMMNNHEEEYRIGWKKEQIIESETLMEAIRELIDYLMDYKFK